jgi:hypothetical protein
MKRKTIGENPLDALIPMGEPKREPQKRVGSQVAAALKTSTRRKDSIFRDTVADKKPEKERLTVHLPVAVIDRAKNAVYWSPGLTLAGLAETAFLKTLEKLEKENGGPFDPRKEELKGGRPIK